MKRMSQIKTAPLPQLPLEMAVIEWCNEPVSDKEQGTRNKEQQVINSEDVIKSSSINKPEPEKRTLVEKVKDLVHKSEPFTMDDVQKCWTNFLHEIELHYPSLAFILKMAHLLEVNNNVLKLGVGFSFHCDKLSEKKC